MAAESENPVDAPLLAGRYRLGARKGSALDATLLEAYDEQLGRPVAVKLVHPDLSADPVVQQAFRAALDGVAAVHHPNLVAVHEWGRSTWNGHDVLYVVTEQLGGGSLRDIIDRGRLLSSSQALMVGLDACKGLDALHRAGIVHGEIRPGTVVFGDDRRLRLVDAGLATVLGEASGGPRGRINDLAKYCSPEEALDLPTEPKSDVYSLCLTLLECLTGTVPFVGDSTVATLTNRLDRLMPVSADLGALAAVLERAGRPQVADRYSAAEFGRALVQAAERLPKPAPLPLLTTSLFADSAVAPSPAFVPTPVPPLPAPTSAAVAMPAPVPSSAAPVPPPPPPPPPVPNVPELGPDDDLEPGDEFPERVEPTSGGRRWFLAVLALMAIAGGVLAWYSTRPQYRTVPAVAAMEEGQALNALAGDFNGVVSQEASDTVDAGKVIRTDPAAGTEVKKGADVAVYVSTGPAPRVLPELTGLTVVQATSKLEGMGLVVAIASPPTYDEHILKDTVMSWTVPDSPAVVAGGTVTKGTTVQLVVSAGPAPRTVPKLIGLTVPKATAALSEQQLGIKVKSPTEFHPSIPAGAIIRQSVKPGGKVDRDSTVIVVVSKGPDLVAVPSPIGLDYRQVRSAITKAGFKVGKVTGDTSKRPTKFTVDGKVVHHGDRIPRGSTIDIAYQP